MKKLMYVFVAMLMASMTFVSCDKDDDDKGGSKGTKACWIFKLTMTTKMTGIPDQVMTTEQTACDLTEQEAEQALRRSHPPGPRSSVSKT